MQASSSPSAAAGAVCRPRPLALGLGAAVALRLLPAPDGIGAESWSVVAVAVLMAVWWVTEALPLAVTALVPLIAFPLLGIAGPVAAAAPYADPLIFLFLGGFLIGRAVETSGLHRRLAHFVLRAAGTDPPRVVGGFLLASAGCSMWISNTATAIMLLPVALAVTRPMADADGTPRPGARAVLLAVAWGCSIGGIATLIGTPPNALLAAFLGRELGVEIGFAAWMAMALPVAVLLLVVAWILLAHVLFRDTAAATGPGLPAPGPVSVEERRVLGVAAATAVGWLTRPLLDDLVPGLTDVGIGLVGAVALFALPSGTGRRLLDRGAAAAIRWDVLLLFGGGLSLAAAISGSGLAAALGAAVADGVGDVPPLLLIAAVTAVVVFVTELASNTATAAAFLPVLAGLALETGAAPLVLLLPATLAASCAFMMPVATPPNAIVFGSGQLTVGDMVRAGFWLNLVAIAVLTAASWALAAAGLLGP